MLCAGEGPAWNREVIEDKCHLHKVSPPGAARCRVSRGSQHLSPQPSPSFPSASSSHTSERSPARHSSTPQPRPLLLQTLAAATLLSQPHRSSHWPLVLSICRQLVADWAGHCSLPGWRLLVCRAVLTPTWTLHMCPAPITMIDRGGGEQCTAHPHKRH